MANEQDLPIFDKRAQHTVGRKEHESVHRDGDWHYAIQANIIRPHGASFDILVQKRSDAVDIGKGKYDQSLATQLIAADQFSTTRAMYRGLKEELDAVPAFYSKLDMDMRIVKRYPDQPEMYNRERVALYVVRTEDDPHIANPKVAEIFWLPWKEFLDFYTENDGLFTKTARMYFDIPQVRNAIEAESHYVTGGKRVSYPHLRIWHVDLSEGKRRTYIFDGQ